MIVNLRPCHRWTSVTQVGSPENSSSYSGVRRKAHHAQFDHQVVNELLRLLFAEHASLHVTLNINIDKGGYPANAHGSTVL